jgi:hypothetical protein
MRIEQLDKQNMTLTDRGTIWDDLGVRPFYRRAMRRKWLLFALPIAWLIFSNIGFALSGKAYSGELLVVPASLTGTSGPSSGLGDVLGGFGLDMGGLSSSSPDQNFTIYLESWTSSWFAEQILQNPMMMRRVFAGLWDSSARQWKQPQGIGSVIKPAIKSIFGGTPAKWSPPTVDDVQAFLKGHVTAEKVRGRVTTIVTIEVADRDLARDLLQFGHNSINAHLAALFRKRADENIAYILHELNEVSITDYRNALTDTLKQVERQRMLAFSNPEFAAQALTLTVSTNPTKPQTSKILIAALLVAILLYGALVIVADWLRLPSSLRSGLHKWRPSR